MTFIKNIQLKIVVLLNGLEHTVRSGIETLDIDRETTHVIEEENDI